MHKHTYKHHNVFEFLWSPNFWNKVSRSPSLQNSPKTCRTIKGDNWMPAHVNNHSSKLHYMSLYMWACLVEGFNTLAPARVLNLPDKRVDPDCWLRSGFESPRRQLDFKPLSGSHQLRTLRCRATLLCASFGGANNILPSSINFRRGDDFVRNLT